MSYLKSNKYINQPFSCESSPTEFYSYSCLKDLTSKCSSQNKVSRCRTIGILQSISGKFYLVDLDSEIRKTCPEVRLSLIYLKSTLPSTVIPFPVQVFGLLQWKNRPVIYVNLLQVLSVGMALKLRDAMNDIANRHIATQIDSDDENDLSENS